jgi:uncharacterized protein (TIGR04222 family)
MSVFDLPGPQFIALYIGFAATLAVLTFAILTWSRGSATAPGPDLLADPYQIAFLRRGLSEIGRLGIVSLADRGLVELPRNGVVEPVTGRRTPRGLHPVEKAILLDCPRPTGQVGKVIMAARVRQACREVREQLVGLGLAPNPQARMVRALICLAVAAMLIGVGLVKLGIAIERGHRNIDFLVLAMGVVAIVFAVMAITPHRTPQGKAMLADLSRLLSVRRGASRPADSGSEALLLAAVYGAAGLGAYSQLQSAYARATPAPGSSSCGSGSSCSSGDGGSGCGGGGGCGGCGSS